MAKSEYEVKLEKLQAQRDSLTAKKGMLGWYSSEAEDGYEIDPDSKGVVFDGWYRKKSGGGTSIESFFEGLDPRNLGDLESLKKQPFFQTVLQALIGMLAMAAIVAAVAGLVGLGTWVGVGSEVGAFNETALGNGAFGNFFAGLGTVTLTTVAVGGVLAGGLAVLRGIGAVIMPNEEVKLAKVNQKIEQLQLDHVLKNSPNLNNAVQIETLLTAMEKVMLKTKKEGNVSRRADIMDDKDNRALVEQLRRLAKNLPENNAIRRNTESLVNGFEKISKIEEMFKDKEGRFLGRDGNDDRNGDLFRTGDADNFREDVYKALNVGTGIDLNGCNLNNVAVQFGDNVNDGAFRIGEDNKMYLRDHGVENRYREIVFNEQIGKYQCKDNYVIKVGGFQNDFNGDGNEANRQAFIETVRSNIELSRGLMHEKLHDYLGVLDAGIKSVGEDKNVRVSDMEARLKKCAEEMLDETGEKLSGVVVQPNDDKRISQSLPSYNANQFNEVKRGLK